MNLLILVVATALATEDFDPSAPAERFTGQETWTIDGETRLWSEIELLQDADRTLFQQEAFNSVTAWAEGSTYAPWIAECFGTGEPHSGDALLHVGLSAETASGTPVLFVPGAADNGSRGFVTMAMDLDARGRPVYALTFAHPHGDVFQQAEWVANAIARLKARTGAEQVDLVAHSKGGLAVAVYISHTADADWDMAAYEEVGTPYRGDVRRAVFIASPLGGIDANFRWSSLNLSSLSADTALSPASWSRYYPYTTGAPYVYEELSEQDFYAEDGDLFPGQRQLLARQDDYPLPGSLTWLGAYAVQYDWYTTYEGGLGYYSYSEGIDAAIAAGGDLVARIESQGADPGVELYLLAGESPLMPNGSESALTEIMGELWVDLATLGTDIWAAFLAELVGEGMVPVGISEAEVQGLASGKVIIGEVTGPSDGLVFVTSATREEALTARGAEVEETYIANLSHLDLLYASQVNAERMAEAAAADPLEDGWMAGFAARYAEADTVGWLAEVLADPEAGEGEGEGEGEDETGDPGGDSGGGEGSEETDSGETVKDPGCGCGTSGGPTGLGWMVAGIAVWGRRRGVWRV